MFNKSFFLGILTTLLTVAILATGALVAVRAFQTPVGFEQRGSARHFERDGLDNPGAPGQGDQRGDGNFYNEGRHGRHDSAASLGGLAGVLGSLFLIGLIVAVVVGGAGLFKRFRGRPAPPPAPLMPAGEPEGETPAADDTPEASLAEAPAVFPEDSVEPTEPPVEPPAG